MIKKSIVLLLVPAVFIFPVIPIQAQKPDHSMSNERKSATRSTALQTRFEKGKEHALRLADKRLLSLSNTKNRIAQMTRISEEDRNAVIGLLDESYDGLKALKVQIESSDDTEVLKLLIEGIFYDYRIYSVLMPQVRGLTASGKAAYVLSDKSEKAVKKLEETVTALESAGVDASNLKSLIAEFETYIAEAQVLIMDAKNSFSLMKPGEDLTEAKRYLEEGKGYLKQVKEKTKNAHQALAKIRQELRLHKESSNATDSAKIQ